MITYANLYQIYAQTDGLVRLEFKAADPSGKLGPTTTSIVYMKMADALALSKSLAEVMMAEMARSAPATGKGH